MDRKSNVGYPRPALLALLLAAACAADTGAPGVELTILHVNDLHARLLPDSQGRGGFAQVATMLQRERSAATAHLTLHAGDMVQGTPVSTLFQGAPIFTIANGLGIDVHCLGNHEFDYGWQKIPEYVRLADFDTVSANVVDDTGALAVDPFVVREAGGLRIAVVGAMTEHLPRLVSSSGLGPWRALPLLETLRPVVAEAAAASDMVIVLGHLASDEAAAIVASLPEVAVVVQGHPHGARTEALEVDGRLVVHASGYGRDVGRLRLTYDPRARRIRAYEWEVLPVRAAELTPDPAVESLVLEWEARAAELVDVPIGRAPRELAGEDLMRVIRAALRDETRSDLAYYNRGGIRDVLPAGELLARHAWNVLPFDNDVVTTRLTGRQIAELHDAVIRDVPIEGYESLEPERMYRLATSDFNADQWRSAGVDLEWTDTGTPMRDMFIAWIQSRPTVTVDSRGSTPRPLLR